MAGRIWIGPYKPLGVSAQAVPGGGYLDIDASAGNFGPSPLLQLGLQAAQGATGIAGVVAEQLAGDNEATVKLADTRVGETEQALLFDPQNGYLNLQGQDAVAQAQAVLDAYTKAQDRERATLTDDDQRRMFGELADRRLATFTTQVQQHTAAERERWHDQASDHRIALMQADAALHWNDDALLRRSLGTARAEVREQAERKGWDSASTEAALHHQTSRTLVSAISAAVDHDPKRAQALRARYATAIEGHHLTALDALLTEAQTRERAQAASTEILNAAPPDGTQPTPDWRLRQAEAIAEPGVRAATIRRLLSATAAVEASARALGEQVLARVLKDNLTDPSQIPIREWALLDAERRQAIETRLDHNAASTEPEPNPKLVDDLATEMTQAPYDFMRRDLVPAVAHLPLPQWQRFRDWQAGMHRNDPATASERHAIKRGLQIANKMLPAGIPDDSATNFRAKLVEDIDAERRITGKSPDDDDIAGVIQRHATPVAFGFPLIPNGLIRRRPEIHQIQDANRPGGRMGTVVRRLTRGAAGAGRILWGSEPEIAEIAAALGYVVAKSVPERIKTQGQTFFYNPLTKQYITASPYELGHWLVFDALGRLIGVYSIGLDAAIPREQLPPELEREWTKPPPHISPPPTPPFTTPIPAPQLPEIEVFPAPPPALPDIEIFPLPPPTKPQIIERRAERWDLNEAWEEHHHIPQETYQYGKKRRIPFSPDAVDLFDEQTVRIPKDEHWSDLHGAYNKAARKALMDYLEKNKNPRETSEEFAGRMTRGQAQKCYEYMINAILNPSKDLNEDEARIAKDAKEFLENVSQYVPKRKPN